LNVWYLFLGGAGAGAFFLLALMSLLSPWATGKDGRGRASHFVPQAPYTALFAPGLLLSFILLALSALCLVADMGRLDRLLYLFLYPTWSLLTIGSYALTVLLVAGAVLLAAWLRLLPPLNRGVVRVVEVLGMVAAVVMMVYTGLLFYSIGEGLLWGLPVITVLFVLSSLSTGIALIIVPTFFTTAGTVFLTVIRRLAFVDVFLILCEAACAALLLVFAAGGGEWSSGSVRQLLEGVYQTAFLGGFLLIGLAVPFMLEALFLWQTGARRRLRAQGATSCDNVIQNSTLIALASSAVLAGGLFLRYCIIGAGAPLFMAGAWGWA
jgi:formate-dependent nitrite reductase membrane component NrfD